MGQDSYLGCHILNNMRRLPSVETDTVQLEIGECDCGYHFGIDATYLEQVGDLDFHCPSCGRLIETAKIFPEDESNA